MRMVIDSNQLQSLNLRQYLFASPSNYAVITDYCSMEAYKENTLISIYKSMEILSEFPRQVIILKNTIEICGLSGKRSSLQKRMIDERQTKKFRQYVRDLNSARSGNVAFQKVLLELGEEANSHMARLLRDAVRIKKGIQELFSSYTKDERALIRRDADLPTTLVNKAIKDVRDIAATLFVDHPSSPPMPKPEDLPNTFIFRYTLSHYLLALDWCVHGGNQDVALEKMRNDMIDMSFVAYATYFGGILTQDTKTLRLHTKTRTWLSSHFGCRLYGN